MYFKPCGVNINTLSRLDNLLKRSTAGGWNHISKKCSIASSHSGRPNWLVRISHLLHPMLRYQYKCWMATCPTLNKCLDAGNGSSQYQTWEGTVALTQNSPSPWEEGGLTVYITLTLVCLSYEKIGNMSANHVLVTDGIASKYLLQALSKSAAT